jgi:hypothetical protein
MEDLNQPLDAGADNAGQRLRFTEPVRSDLLETSKWVMFFAVLLFIVLGLIAIASLMMIFTAGAYGFGMAVVMIGIYGTLIFFPAWYYYKFSTLTRQALNYNDNDALDDGFAYLKRFYRFVGILIIVFIAFYLVAVIIGLSMFMGNDLLQPVQPTD